MIVFRYQLRHIGRGRQRMKDYIHAVQPNLVRYTELVQEIRGKGKERKSLLAQKKETPLYLIPKQCELSRHIAELTEELEELKSEKDMLLHSLECSDGMLLIYFMRKRKLAPSVNICVRNSRHSRSKTRRTAETLGNDNIYMLPHSCAYLYPNY